MFIHFRHWFPLAFGAKGKLFPSAASEKGGAVPFRRKHASHAAQHKARVRCSARAEQTSRGVSLRRSDFLIQIERLAANAAVQV